MLSSCEKATQVLCSDSALSFLEEVENLKKKCYSRLLSKGWKSGEQIVWPQRFHLFLTAQELGFVLQCSIRVLLPVILYIPPMKHSLFAKMMNSLRNSLYFYWFLLNAFFCKNKAIIISSNFNEFENSSLCYSFF